MGSAGNGRNKARGAILKALALIGGALLLRKLTRSATRWDHARVVANALSGEKVSSILSFSFSVLGVCFIVARSNFHLLDAVFLRAGM